MGCQCLFGMTTNQNLVPCPTFRTTSAPCFKHLRTLATGAEDSASCWAKRNPTKRDTSLGLICTARSSEF